MNISEWIRKHQTRPTGQQAKATVKPYEKKRGQARAAGKKAKASRRANR